MGQWKEFLRSTRCVFLPDGQNFLAIRKNSIRNTLRRRRVSVEEKAKTAEARPRQPPKSPASQNCRSGPKRLRIRTASLNGHPRKSCNDNDSTDVLVLSLE